MNPSRSGGTLTSSAREEEQHEPEKTNDHSGMGKVRCRRRGGWLRKGNPMGRYPWLSTLDRYLSEAFAGKTHGYAKQVRRYLKKCEKYLIRLKLPTNPKHLKNEQIATLYVNAPWVSLHERSMIMTRLRPFLAFCGNRVMYTMKNLDLRPPSPIRPQYSEFELVAIRNAAKAPYERWLVHMEMDYGCRKITVLRARPEDFDQLNQKVLLRVKGRGGTKTMEAPMHPDTPSLLDEVLIERSSVIERCRAEGWSGIVSQELMLNKYGGRPKAITGNGLDEMLKRICERAGVKPRGHHANRRGVSRIIYNETQDIVATQAFLGHADPRTTEIYIGMDLTHQAKAQAALQKRLNSSILTN